MLSVEFTYPHGYIKSLRECQGLRRMCKILQVFELLISVEAEQFMSLKEVVGKVVDPKTNTVLGWWVLKSVQPYDNRANNEKTPTIHVSIALLKSLGENSQLKTLIIHG